MVPLIHSSKYSYPTHLLKLTKSSGRRFLFPVPLYFFLGLPAQLRCFLHRNPTKPPPTQASGDQRMDRNPFFNPTIGSHRIKGLRTRLKLNYHIARLSRVITVNYFILPFQTVLGDSSRILSPFSVPPRTLLYASCEWTYSRGNNVQEQVSTKRQLSLNKKLNPIERIQVILITWIK